MPVRIEAAELVGVETATPDRTGAGKVKNVKGR